MLNAYPTMTFAQLREFWRVDLYRHTGETGWRHMLTNLLFSDGGERFSDGVKYVFYFRLCRYLKSRRPRLVFWPLYRIAMRVFTHYKYKFGCSIPHSTSIGRGLYIGHIRDIVINEGAVIGDNCNISQGVTIGQANRGRRKGTPVIGQQRLHRTGRRSWGRFRWAIMWRSARTASLPMTCRIMRWWLASGTSHFLRRVGRRCEPHRLSRRARDGGDPWRRSTMCRSWFQRRR